MYIELFGITINLFETLCCIGMAGLGILSAWYKQSAVAQETAAKLTSDISNWKLILFDAASTLIAEAESKVDLTTNEDRYAYVAAHLHDMLPDAIEPYITEEWIKETIESTFISMKGYAFTILDKITEKITSDSDSEE